ncbi:MAG: alpha/beta fold hydrolase, partial [Pseudomonadota bacterium]
MRDTMFKQIEDSLRDTARDPFGFTELVDRWNAVFDAEDVDVGDALDAAVDETFDTIASESTGGVISHRLRQMLNSLPHPSLAVRSDGIVTAMNDAGMERLSVDPGETADALGYALEGGDMLADVIRAKLRGQNEHSDIVLRRAVHEATDRTATLAIVPSVDENGPQALIFVIDPIWRAEVEAFLGRAYALTRSESGVLMEFLDGHTLKDISVARGTSYATVRTQFQSVMAKTGARSQSELMRNTLAVSQFFSDMDDVADIARHPHRKTFTFFAEGGRSIDVALAGDMDGELVLSIPDATLWCHAPPIEQSFKDAGLCVATVCRPGFGVTDPPPAGVDYIDCLEKDLRTVLQQLGRSRAVLFGHNISSVFAYAMASRMDDVLSRIVIKSTLVPAPMLDGEGVRSSWARALMRGVQKSPSMYRVIIYSAIKAWKAMGSRRMLAMQLRGFEPDEEIGQRRDAIQAYEQAMRMTLSQGTEYATYSFKLAATDWTLWVQAARVPIDLVIARHDPSSSWEAVTRFAAQYPEKVTAHIIEDG